MIEIQNLSKTYCTKDGQVVALKEVDLTIRKGEFVLLKGPSGSGKSTLLSLIAAFAKPTSGSVVIDSKPISKFSEDFASAFRRENIGFIFQHYNLIEGLTLLENLIAPLVVSKLSRASMLSRAREVASDFGIQKQLHRKVSSLSGGQQQRVAIARALINDPKIILADEPTANLDTTLVQEFIDHLRRLKSKGRTIVLATHDPLFYNLDLVDSAYEIKRGRLCF